MRIHQAAGQKPAARQIARARNGCIADLPVHNPPLLWLRAIGEANGMQTPGSMVLGKRRLDGVEDHYCAPFGLCCIEYSERRSRTHRGEYPFCRSVSRALGRRAVGKNT